MEQRKRDHGGGIDAAVAEFGGQREAWVDLSTGINPQPYPVSTLSAQVWNTLPDRAAQEALLAAARAFWKVPEEAAILAAPGASALIARIPALAPPGRVDIPQPTYNEHGAAFAAHGWQFDHTEAQARVIVHPNNPTGQLYREEPGFDGLHIIDESFCDVCPEESLIAHATRKNTLILKSFGKFWGLAGVRLGFAIGDPALINRLEELMGPWPVAGPALQIGTKALGDSRWAAETRYRLCKDSDRLDQLMQGAGAQLQGGCTLFRLYQVDDALEWRNRLARAHVWTRVFPYSDQLIRLGLPGPGQWARLEGAL